MPIKSRDKNNKRLYGADNQCTRCNESQRKQGLYPHFVQYPSLAKRYPLATTPHPTKGGKYTRVIWSEPTRALRLWKAYKSSTRLVWLAGEKHTMDAKSARLKNQQFLISQM